VAQEKKKRTYHHGDLRRALIDASIKLIESGGVAALTLREVAQRVGVSHAAPHHHFPDKTALLAAVSAEGFRELTTAMQEAAERAGENPVKRLTATGVAYVEFAVHHPRQFRLMFGADMEPASDPELKKWSDRAFVILLDAAGAALTKKKQEDAKRLLVTVAGAWASVHGLATLWIDGRLEFARESFPTAERLAREVTDALARSFGP
jgi:AcrR family transcriptional regulator